jgi:hypothetical protein
MMEEAAAPAEDEDLMLPVYIPKFPTLSQLSVENRVGAVTEYVKALAALPKCIRATSRGQPVAARCDCLRQHVQKEPRLAARIGLAVANFKANPRTERTQTLITWIHYADIMASLINGKRRQFLLIETKPENEEAEGAADEAAEEEAEEDPYTTQAKLVCQSTLMRLIGMGPDAWK